MARCVEEAGIGFFFAPVFHPGMRHAAVPRREMGIATVFNFLGPLTNPARPAAAAIGVADARMAPVVAEVLAGRSDVEVLDAAVLLPEVGGAVGDDGCLQLWPHRDGTDAMFAAYLRRH